MRLSRKGEPGERPGWTASAKVGVEQRPNPSRRDDGSVSFGPAVTVELPHVAHFFDLVQVHVSHYYLILVAAAHSEHLSARIAEIRLPVELADGPGLFDPDAIDGANEGLVGDGMGGLFKPPEVFAQAGHCGRGIEHHFRAIQPQAARAVGEMAVVANINPDLAHRSVKDRIA